MTACEKCERLCCRLQFQSGNQWSVTDYILKSAVPSTGYSLTFPLRSQELCKCQAIKRLHLILSLLRICCCFLSPTSDFCQAFIWACQERAFLVHNHFSAEALKTHSVVQTAHTFCQLAHNLTQVKKWHHVNYLLWRECPGCTDVTFSSSLRSETSRLNNSQVARLCQMRWSLSDTQISFNFPCWRLGVYFIILFPVLHEAWLTWFRNIVQVFVCFFATTAAVPDSFSLIFYSMSRCIDFAMLNVLKLT